MLKIRKATLDDLKAIQQVCKETWYATYHDIYTKAYIDRVIHDYYNGERLKEDIEEDSPFWNGYWVAQKGEEVVGCIGGGMDEKGQANVYVLYVAPKSQRQGAGHLLLQKLTQHQKQRYRAQVQWVTVTEDNLIGLSFYEKEGFQFVEAVENPNDTDEVRDFHFRRSI